MVFVIFGGTFIGVMRSCISLIKLELRVTTTAAAVLNSCQDMVVLHQSCSRTSSGLLSP